MKTLHLDCFSGISGNMFVGMLIQAGVPFEAFQKAMASLQLTGYELLCRSENKGGVQAVYYNVILDDEKHDAHHDHEHHITMIMTIMIMMITAMNTITMLPATSSI